LVLGGLFQTSHKCAGTEEKLKPKAIPPLYRGSYGDDSNFLARKVADAQKRVNFVLFIVDIDTPSSINQFQSKVYLQVAQQTAFSGTHWPASTS
jgi:hypothetical protein